MNQCSEASMRVYNKTLDPTLWDENLQLDPEVRLALLKIGKDFYSGTDLKAPLIDIFFIGSSANFNWTPQSDIDVHVTIDISKEGINPLYARKFMDGLGGAWNKDHDIEIKDHPVEMYLQDQTEPNGSPSTFRPGVAIYSLFQGKWLVKPNPEKIIIDKDKIKSKFNALKSQIEILSSTEDYAGLKALMKKLKNYRNAGLKANGELGTENLVFKALRHTGLLEKMRDAIKIAYDRMVHIDESIAVGRPFIVAGMTAQDLDVAGDKYYEGDKIITHGQLRSKYGNWAGTEDWRYRSDINTIMWWGLPDEDERQATLDWLKKKYGINRPKEILAKATSDQMKQMLHYPFIVPGKKLFEIDESKEYYVVGIVDEELNIVVQRYKKRENYITHDQLRAKYGNALHGDSAYWRYHSQGNWIFWWEHPTEEQLDEVRDYLRRKFGVYPDPTDEYQETINRGRLSEAVGRPYLIVGLVNEEFQVFGKRDFGTGDEIGSHTIEHGQFDQELSRIGWDWAPKFSHWRYKSINNTLYWWPGDPFNDDLKDVVLDYLHTKWDIRKPKIVRNEESYFADAHFILELLCEAGQKDKIIYGNVDDELHVNGVRSHDASSNLGGNHIGVGKRWRYRTIIPYVFWWDDGPSEEEKESVEYYLYKHFGIKVHKHKRFTDFTGQDFWNASVILHGTGDTLAASQKMKIMLKEVVNSNQIVYGNVDDDGVINNVHVGAGNHHGDGKRWRFKFAIPQYVFWWDEPSEVEEESVNEYFQRKYNLTIRKHRILWDFSNNFQTAMHDPVVPIPKNELMEKVNEEKFNPYKAKALQFVTYGGLSLTKQKGFDPEKAHSAQYLHTPPARRGIYAFVWPYVEKFLLGGDQFVDPKIRGKGQRARIEYIRDKEGNVVTTGHPDYERLSNIQKNWSLTRRKPGAPTGTEAEEAKWNDIYQSILYRNVNRKKFSYNGPLWHHLKDGVTQDKILDEKGAWIKTDMDAYHDAFMKELHQMNKDRLKFGRMRTTLDHMEVFIDQKI